MFKTKKIICVFICLVSLFVLFSFSASAVQVGDSTILGVKGQIWNQYADGKFYDGVVNNQTDKIVFTYQLPITTSSLIATYSYLSYSGYNYGTLTLSYYSNFGNICYDNFNGLYDDSGNKIASFSVSNNRYTLEYKGKIPSNLSIRAYFTANNNDPLQAYTLVDFSFLPSYENITSDIINNQNQNADKITSNQNANADKITSNQNANADKLIQNDKEMYENEKAETESSGNDSIDSLTSIIPSDTEGVINSFSGLINCMLYTGTDVDFNFPALKTPAIMGIPSYTLLEETPVNFKQIESIIPPAIMLTLRALLTIALIIFCFKELYGTISYVLTLRGGASE